LVLQLVERVLAVCPIAIRLTEGQDLAVEQSHQRGVFPDLPIGPDLGAIDGVALDGELPSFLRMGSWIGSDRDGNPFVTEEVLRAALRAQNNRALKHYLDSYICWAASCRSTAGWWAIRMRSRNLPRARPTNPPIDNTNHTDALLPGFIRAWQRRQECPTSSALRTRP
jgi:Phosphoenolpyruvate carboxylase